MHRTLKIILNEELLANKKKINKSFVLLPTRIKINQELSALNMFSTVVRNICTCAIKYAFICKI